jgi:hypothetical protein
MDGKPEETFVNFGPDADAHAIQVALDNPR